MAASSIQQFKVLGESMGLSGSELAECVKEQQSAERADRQAERDRQKRRRNVKKTQPRERKARKRKGT